MLELKATNISYGPVSADAFDVSPPAGAKVVKVSTPGGRAARTAADKRRSKGGRDRQHAKVQGVAAVAKKVPFTLTAPSTLVGLPRRSVSCSTGAAIRPRWSPTARTSAASP